MKTLSKSCNLCLYLIFVLSAILHAGSVHAQQVYTLDLAAPITEQTVSEDDPFKLRIKNRVPTARYGISVTREFIEIPAFELPSSKGEQFQVQFDDLGDGCSNAIPSLDRALDDAETESEVDTSIRSAIRDARAAECEEDLIDRLKTLAEDRTVRTLPNQYSLARGEVLKVRVQRVSADTDEVREEFAFALTPGPRGEWRLQYGLTFVPERNEHFFSRQVGDDASLFTIEQDRVDESAYDLIPTLLFTWLPAEFQLESVNLGVTGGIGYNLRDPSAFFGAALTFNENLSLTGGVVMHKQSRLRGRYSVGDTLQQSIDRDLLTEGRYYPNWYVGLSLRLSSNPFSRNSDSESNEGATTPGVFPDDNGESNTDEGNEVEDNEDEAEEESDSKENDGAEESRRDFSFDPAIVSEGDTVLGFQVTEISLTEHSRSDSLTPYHIGTVAFEGESEIAGYPKLDDSDSLYVELLMDEEFGIPRPMNTGTTSRLYFADRPDEILERLKIGAEERASTDDDTPVLLPLVRFVIRDIRIEFPPVKTDENVSPPPSYAQATLVRGL